MYLPSGKDFLKTKEAFRGTPNKEVHENLRIFTSRRLLILTHFRKIVPFILIITRD